MTYCYLSLLSLPHRCLNAINIKYFKHLRDGVVTLRSLSKLKRNEVMISWLAVSLQLKIRSPNRPCYFQRNISIWRRTGSNIGIFSSEFLTTRGLEPNDVKSLRVACRVLFFFACGHCPTTVKFHISFGQGRQFLATKKLQKWVVSNLNILNYVFVTIQWEYGHFREEITPVFFLSHSKIS